MSTAKMAGLFLTMILASCSSMKTIENASSNSIDGLNYYMPKKDFLITVTTKDQKAEKISFGTTPSYPDLSRRYMLRHGTNVFGKNTLDVGVSDSGLLTTTKSTTESNVSNAFKNLASSIGQMNTFEMAEKPPTDTNCRTNGEHTFILREPGKHMACGITIEIKVLADDLSIVDSSKEVNWESSGVFYRQNIPYLVSASGGGVNAASLVFSPSASKTYFLPVSRTFFSNNQADFTFDNGVPKQYKQETEGEIVALFKIPADVLSAYFSAIGSVFDSFKNNDNKEAAALSESIKLELLKKKYDACIAAIQAKDDAKIKELACQ